MEREARCFFFAAGISTLVVRGALLPLTAVVSLPHCLAVMVVASTMMLTNRLLWRGRLKRRINRGVISRNFLLVGLNSTSERVRTHLSSLPCSGYTFKGKLPFADGSDAAGTVDEPLLGRLEDLDRLVREHFIDEVILTERPSTRVLNETIARAKAIGVDLRLIPDPREATLGRADVEFLGIQPTIVLHQRPAPLFSLFCKRVLDVLGASLVLMLTLPISLIVAVAIRLDSDGPLVYASERVGLKGRTFRCYKFRTMVQDAERKKAELAHLNERSGILFKIAFDPRVTRVGRPLRKYSLDEIPQLWNVLKGDMSLVGPRPPLPCEVARYQSEHLKRLAVMPGITGLWQVQARGEASFESYVDLDRKYVANWCLWLDLKILFRTISVVLGGTGS